MAKFGPMMAMMGIGSVGGGAGGQPQETKEEVKVEKPKEEE
jgi:hypothetical protein